MASAISRYAFDPPEGMWTLTRALRDMPEGGARHLAETIARYEASLRSLAERDPKLDSSLTRPLIEAMLPIGVKLRPDMNREQAGAWALALLKGWSDLPPFVLRETLAGAVHVPFQFPSEIDLTVRTRAEELRDKHRTAINRLRMMRAEIMRAANPPPAITDETARPMDLDEIRRCPKNLRQMGVKIGAIEPDMLAQVEAEESGSAATAER